MTFWMAVCYCRHCVARFRKEMGAEPPRIVDWQNPNWVCLQRARERWMKEFAGVMTDCVHRINPDITVSHQYSSILTDWRMGVSFDQVDHCDFLSGDFYGPSIQQSLVCKIYSSVSSKRPFEFHTACFVDFVTAKTPHRLATQAYLAPAHSSAFLVIDTIDPDGTLHDYRYRPIKAVFDEIKPYEPELGGEICFDVGVYYSGESRFDPSDNGKDISQFTIGTLGHTMPHLNALLGACDTLRCNHIPFGIITKRNLSNLENIQVLLLPDVLVMDDAEVAAIKEFVNRGGALYASSRTSMGRIDGKPSKDFLLADLFGVSFVKECSEKLVYFTPQDGPSKKWLGTQKHIAYQGKHLSISIQNDDVIVRAMKTQPYTDPDVGEIFGKTFSSIHCDPPGPSGDEPAIVAHKYGAGQVVYVVGTLEESNSNIHREFLANLIHSLLCRPVWFEADVHPSIEVVMFHQADRKRMIISLFPSEEALVGVSFKAQLRVRVPKRAEPARMVRLPDGENVEYSTSDNYIDTCISLKGSFEMFALEYN